MWAYITVVAAGGIIFLLAVGHLAQTRNTSTAVDHATQVAVENNEKLMKSLDGLLRPSPTPADPNSLEGRAQAELKRMTDQLHGSAPPADPQGSVHLQSGGAVSAEQWERARRSLGQ